MSAPHRSSSLPDNARTEYLRRLDRLAVLQSRYEAIDARLSLARFALMLSGTLFALWLVVGKAHSLLWVAVPVALFIFVAVVHERVLRSQTAAKRAAAFYDRGLARLDHRWMGKGQSGERFKSDSHPYARDLDIFGGGSIFEMLCTARTRAGEDMLARWLLDAASVTEIKTRQIAVADLRERLAFREDLAVSGDSVQAGARPELLLKWAEGRNELDPKWLRLLLGVLAGLWMLGLAAWATLGFWYLAAALTVLNATVASWLRRRASSRVQQIEAAVQDIRLVANVLARMESENFDSGRLKSLQAELSGQGEPASERVLRLAKLSESLQSRRNLIVGGLDRFIFWTLQHVLAIEAWREREGAKFRTWLEALGEIEALNDLANYAYEHPEDVFPEFTDDAPCFQAHGLAHPLVAAATGIKNDLSLGRDLRLMVISGPNMAGKSTFIRAVGVNAVLGQCGGPVRAQKLKMSPLRVAASVCVLDSLQGGVSRFYAEITRLKLIMDMAKGTTSVLYLLDELLSGTNSHDRQIGAEAVIRGLYQHNAIGLVTTHDLALTAIADLLTPAAQNVHFQDSLIDGKLRFDYQLTPGVVQTSNALALMRSIGLEV